jgi:hypothetical protein
VAQTKSGAARIPKTTMSFVSGTAAIISAFSCGAATPYKRN